MDENLDTVSLEEIVKTLWGKRLWVGLCVLAVGFLSTIYVLLQPNVYKSSALLSVNETIRESGKTAGAGLSGGISQLLGTSPDKNDTIKIAILNSSNMINAFAKKHHLEAQILAAIGWNKNTNTLIYDDNIYNGKDKAWMPTRSFFGLIKNDNLIKPTPWLIDKAFKEKYLDISQDVKTGLITLSITHFSPDLSKQWVDWFVEDINEHIRDADIKDAQDNLSYLRRTLSENNLIEMKGILTNLMVDESRTLMLANVQKDYAFRIIDPAVLPDRKLGPKRLLIIVLSLIVGFGASCVGVLIFQNFRRKYNSH